MQGLYDQLSQPPNYDFHMVNMLNTVQMVLCSVRPPYIVHAVEWVSDGWSTIVNSWKKLARVAELN